MADHNKNPRYYGDTSGIYKITNDRTGETYIGQSRNIGRRIKDHKNELKQGTHHNKGMQSDYLRGDTFTYTILEKTSSDRQTLHQKEEKYISQYNTFNKGYNQTPGGQYDKYQGYYGHGGGRLSENSSQQVKYTNNAKPKKEVYTKADYETGRCCLGMILILLGKEFIYTTPLYYTINSWLCQYNENVFINNFIFPSAFYENVFIKCKKY